nr:MAG TPA: hypothetical protein [Caudoviricetes sp.]
MQIPIDYFYEYYTHKNIFCNFHYSIDHIIHHIYTNRLRRSPLRFA